MTQFAAEASTTMAKLLGISDFKGVYDFQLEQFGFYRKDGETVLEALDRVLHSDFLSHNDNVFRDLTIDRALELNDDIEIQPNVYYFSYAGDKTRQSTLTGERTSAVDMTPLFVPFANQMCGYYDQTTPAASGSTRAGLRTTALSTPSPPCTRPTAPAAA